MKKVLMLFMCMVLVSSVFAACGTGDIETSSGESLESSQEVKTPPEKVLYFTGEYQIPHDAAIVHKTIYGGKHVAEYLSHEGGIADYLSQNDVSDDTYFLVGGYSGLNGDEYEAYKSKTVRHLKNYGFIEIEDHPMLYDGAYKTELDESETDQEKNQVRLKYAQKRLPDVEFEIGGYKELDIFLEVQIYTVGYISAKDLKKLAAETDENNGLTLVWFPAPDDQERWLTVTRS